jgi:long-chain acyl-CoA synthetase
MSFLDDIFEKLEASKDLVVLEEIRDGRFLSVTGRELLDLVAKARAFLASRRLTKGDRCGLLAPNSIRWVAIDLAIMAEGLIVVPLYSRQAPEELVEVMKDCAPSLLICADDELRKGIVSHWPGAPPQCLFEDVFGGNSSSSSVKAAATADADPVALIYTSGTSGMAKGVILTAGNIGHMLGCASARLDLLMNNRPGQDRVFHYLPLTFAGSWILMLTSLLRGSRLALNTDLSKIAVDMRTASPDYFLNVPQLLERMRKAVDEQIWKTGGVVLNIYSRAKSAWVRKQEAKAERGDGFWLGLANWLVFPTIRKKMIGNNLKALICGSAPLNIETQLYFMMLGIPVLQAYGLTETTALCTLDDPRDVEPGRVGPAITGVEMKLGVNDEVLVRGPNIFPGYWNRPDETAKVLRDGWFHTGDQAEADAKGNWKIIGRLKNLIIPASGHNIAPEPIEDTILHVLPTAQQVVVIGNGRSYLTAIITGDVPGESAQAALDKVNAELPHYKQIRAFHLAAEVFSIENGLLTANGKLKRDQIAERYKTEIEELYRVKRAS